MPELTIHVPGHIGPSYLQTDEYGWCEWVQGLTKADVEMQLEWAKWMGEEPDGILLDITTCDGGSTSEGFAIYNYLRELGLPIRCRILALACSMAVPLALAADNGPEMDYTAQLMIHSAAFNEPIYAPTSTDLRSQADRLDNVNQLLTDLLIARSGQTPEVVAGWMSKDTWLTATQAHGLGLCSRVIPLAPAIKPVEAEATISARRRRATETLARRAGRTPSATTPAAAPRPALSPAPMATTPPKPTPRGTKPAAAKPAARPAAQTAAKPAAAKPAAPKPGAQPQARKGIIQQLKELFAGLDEAEASAAGATDEPTAEVQSTDLDNGAKVYHEGALAVDVAVFNDEALTEATADGDYDTADGQLLTVAAGICTTLEAGEADADDTTPAVARLSKRLDTLAASLKAEQQKTATLTAENERLKRAKPGLPAPVSRVRADAPDAKGARGAQPAANSDAGTL